MMRVVMISLLALVAGCAMAPDVTKLSIDCQARYRVDLPAGATVAKADPPLRFRKPFASRAVISATYQ